MGNLEAAEQNLKESKLIVKERVLTFWSDMESARDRIQSSKNQIKTAREVVDAYWHQFQVGRRSLLDLLNIQSDLFSYQSNQETALYEEKVSKARLLAATGKLANAYQSDQKMVTSESRIFVAQTKQTAVMSANEGNQLADWMKNPGN
jgi:outer membrane protein TolC